MARIEVKCPECSKHVLVKSEIKLKKSVIRKFACGHSHVYKTIAPLIPSGQIEVCSDCLTTIDESNRLDHIEHNLQLVPSTRDAHWTRLYEYQKRGIEFIENTGYKCLNADEMGLGKTAQTLMALRYNYSNLTPTLIIAPAGLIHNWFQECKLWINDRFNEFEDTPIVHTKNTPIMKGMKIVIISNMMISKPKVLKSILEYGFKTIVADESHHFKNDNSNRTDALIKIASKIPHRILLSGTSVLNRTTEYFNTLHLINEYHWPHSGVLAKLCLRSNDGKILSIAPHNKQFFVDRTKQYVLRRTKRDLFKELPPIQINNTYVNVQDNPAFVKVYNQKLDELEQLLNSKSLRMQSGSFMDVIAIIQHLWEYTALAKVKHVVAYTQEFLENTYDNGNSPKITLGGHHRVPRAKIAELLAEYNPIEITDQNAREKDLRQATFKNHSSNRLCIASLLGAGEGRNLDFCHNVLIYERYWNPAKEKQFIGRFYARGLNPDSNEEYEPVIIDYLLASNTIDEFFASMVQLKNEIVQSAIDRDYMGDSDFIINLAEQVVSKRLKYVGG